MYMYTFIPKNYSLKRFVDVYAKFVLVWSAFSVRVIVEWMLYVCKHFMANPSIYSIKWWDLYIAMKF